MQDSSVCMAPIVPHQPLAIKQMNVRLDTTVWQVPFNLKAAPQERTTPTLEDSSCLTARIVLVVTIVPHFNMSAAGPKCQTGTAPLP